APAGFTGTHPEGRTDAWVPGPLGGDAARRRSFYENRDARVVSVIGRLAPGATLAQIQSQLDRLAPELAMRYPATNKSIGFRATPRTHLANIAESANALVTFALVWAMVALLHLVACSNV